MFSIGVDIGGSHISCGIYDHLNKLLLKKTVVHRKVNTMASKDAILESWFSAILETIKSAELPIVGIGIAMPGPFDYSKGISYIAEVDKLNSLYGVNLRLELSSRLGFSPSKIRFINDASAFSIAEALTGKALGYSRVVAITLGTGFGSSFLVDAQPIVQAVNVPKGGFLYNHCYHGILADDIFSTRGITSQYNVLSGKAVKNVRELSELVPQDQDAKHVFELFGENLGEFLSPYLRKFNAEVLVIGGNIAKAYDHFRTNLGQQLPECTIYVSEFGEEAAIIGSALLLDEEFYVNLEPTLKLM
jgi:glucokinase